MCFPNRFLFCHSSLISCHSPLIKLVELCYRGCHFFPLRATPKQYSCFFSVLSYFKKQWLCTHVISFRMWNNAYPSMSCKLFTLLKRLLVIFGFLVYSSQNILGSWEPFNPCFGVIWLSLLCQSVNYYGIVPEEKKTCHFSSFSLWFCFQLKQMS